MIIDSNSIIRRQLGLRQPTTITFPGGKQTLLTPMRCVPQLAGPESRLSLDGQWSMVKWPFPRAEEALAAPAAATKGWPKIAQPGPVFFYDPDAIPADIPNWNRVTLAHVPPEDGALIRCERRIPRAWRGKRIYLRFDSIYPAGRIYLNGQLLGAHLSGLTPAEYDVTALAQPGSVAVIAVRLLRRHRFTQLDMVRHAVEFTGLAQHACLHATGQIQIADYHLISKVSADLAVGTLAGTVRLRNLGARALRAAFKIALTGPDGRTTPAFAKTVILPAGGARDVRVRLRIRNVKLWNDEYPRRYAVTLSLAGPGREVQTVRYPTGFRRFELDPRGPRLNGRPVKFRGVNHLTFHPRTGMYTPEAWLRRNIGMMKKANVNAIRTHFLGPPVLAELCSELGVYLLQELPIDWGTHYLHDPEWMGPILMRLEGGVRRDRHQPSVMVWSVGNENMPESQAVANAGWNHLRICERFVKRLDPSRPTMFPPPGPANKIKAILELRVGDIADTHYSFKLIRNFNRTGTVTNPRDWDATLETTTRAQALRRGWQGVWFSSEYGLFNMIPDLLNAPYLSCIADVEDDILAGKNTLQVFIDRQRREWGYMRSDPTCLGGAYFPWLCSGVGKGAAGNPWGWVRWGEDADWGVITADLLPKPFFWAMRVLFSPVWFPPRLGWAPGQAELRFPITNQFNAVDLADCTLRTQLGGGGKWMGQLQGYRDVPLVCPPGATRTAAIPIWNPSTADALKAGLPVVCRCHLLDPRGFRVISHDIVVIPKALGGKDTSAIPIGPDA